MRRAFPFVFAICLAFTVAPLWAGGHLPAVDLPQHLFLVHVLRALGDPGSAYHEVFERGAGLTYLTFHYTAAALAGLVGEVAAVKLWLSLVLAAIPLSVMALLRAFGRSPWLALLACPLVFTDNFYWGLISFQSSLPLTLLTLAAFVRALEDDRRRWLVALALSLLGLQLTHAAGMLFPAIALPVLLVTTPSTRTRRLRALAALLPGVLVFLAWLAAGVHRGRQVGAEGEAWKAAGPLLDSRNFVFLSFETKAKELFPLLSNGFWDWADRPPLIAWLVVVALLAAVTLATRDSGRRFDPRPLLMFALALGCYFLLPFDIRGYMYMLSPRYSQLAALLLLPLLRLPDGLPSKAAVPAMTALALWSGVTLTGLFRRFDAEARAFDPVAAQIRPGARILHLVMDKRSAVATHAVYVHYAALAAQRSDGIPSFSLALDPSFPVRYRPGARPPAPPSEWRPQQVSWTREATWYDHVLYRGRRPFRDVAGRHAAEFELAAENENWSVWRRR